MQNNYRDIVNYFDNRSTNASAESFNAKIKAFTLIQFRDQVQKLWGISKDISFAEKNGCKQVALNYYFL